MENPYCCAIVQGPETDSEQEPSPPPCPGGHIVLQSVEQIEYFLKREHVQKRAGCEATLQQGRLARCSSWPPPLGSDWQWDGFRQLFGRATGRVNSFPRLKGGHLQNITSSPLGFASCVFHGSWIHNFQCLEMLWKGLQIYQQPDLLRRALYDFPRDICLKCQPGLAEPIFNVWF